MDNKAEITQHEMWAAASGALDDLEGWGAAGMGRYDDFEDAKMPQKTLMAAKARDTLALDGERKLATEH